MAVRGFQPWADELAALQTDNFEVHPEQCVRVRHRQARCTRCADFCPTGAIQIGTALKVVPLRCAQCGLCLAACPTGVFGPKRPGDADIMAGLERAAQRSEQVVFACSLLLRKHRRMRSHPGLVELDCLGRLHESLLVGAVAAGARDVVLSDGLCERCTYEVGRKLANDRVATTRTLLDALGMEAAVRFSEQALPGMPALQDRGTERAAASATGPAGSWSRGQADGPRRCPRLCGI
ncbi:hydrogenase iron-sulfur subunit [Carboxydochorda subterranea]|uniref:Hydrogenase iron-sulfur subunit n=1 Tax=Carboxydichorda subterranea TaxID=3109565 RepID=A0ABZ1BVP9_9FIRM|nr:hydrogenase iron-sulfur subunit [Limnochorda sp. L945t]WRP16849.1 hydrogenase iron-sulfur subunit [Limnochorda sp. L945t]